MSEEVLCYQVNFTRPGDTKVYKTCKLREMKIKDQERAIAASAGKVSKNASNLLEETVVQNELLRLLIVEIDGKRPDRSKLEDLDSYFNYKEYLCLMKALREIIGVDEKGNVGVQSKVEILTSGSK